MDKQVESAITDYIYDLSEPCRNWPDYYFEERSYMRWAAKELLEYIRSNPQKQPVEVTKDFIRKVTDFARSDRRTREDCFIFTVARETAEDILDILTAMA